jgi:serine/threonine protein kinase
MPNPPDKFEHYELLKNPDGSHAELGHGAMGVTYKAFDTSLHCHVALKMISAAYLNDPTAEERFLREARGAAQLRHRNVASVFHLGRCGESHYYAMEFIDGQTVDARVRKDGPLDCALALEVAAQVASALMAAHQQGLVHRDIKPSNLMLARECDGELLVKVIDFGLVKSALVNSNSNALTSTGFVGTPYFASPEQLEQREEDIRSDIYSLGVTLWFMLTGRPTFLGSMASVIMQHLERPPAFEALAVLPADVVALLRRMLEKNAEKRLQTPVELRAEIKRCLAKLSGSAKSSAPATKDEETWEAVALSGTRGVRSRPGAGALLGNRYRLIEDLNPGNPHRTFHAEDVAQKRRVRVKLLEEDPALFKYLESELPKLKGAPHPNFIEVLTAVRPATRDTVGYVVLEWIDGFSLLDVLRVRQELTSREVVVLLQQIAPAIDIAKQAGIQPEISLRDILVSFPEGFDESSEEITLRCPLAEWPAFVVKLNPLGRLAEFELSNPSLAGQTIVPAAKHALEVAHVGRLAYELLGGKPEGFVPLANLPEQGNEILGRCVNPETTYPSARAFAEAFAGVTAHESARSPGKPVDTRTSRPAVPTLRPTAAMASPNRKTGALIAGAIVFLIAIGIGWFWPSTPTPTNEPAPTTPAPIAQTPTTPAPSAPASPSARRQPPQRGQIWTNSLGVAYVPLDDVYFAMTETRMRDFAAFVEATGYDAIGGMYSLQRDGFKQHNGSWKNPGFAQSGNHPVVGVSWEDANQFCGWLTQKERAEGALTAGQFYRLPSDREWSLAVGLSTETGATPEERSGRVKSVYPWGKGFPPPPDAGNYAGSEARQGAPDKWPTIAGWQDQYPRTIDVASHTLNRLGLADLGGNVWEWCASAYNKTSQWRVLRGGSWATSRPEEMLSSFRRGSDPSFRHDDIGFRCVIATDEGER